MRLFESQGDGPRTDEGEREVLPQVRPGLVAVGTVRRDFYKERNTMFKAFGAMAVLAIVANVLIWGGLIYFAFWCAKHFGLIG